MSQIESPVKSPNTDKISCIIKGGVISHWGKENCTINDFRTVKKSNDKNNLDWYLTHYNQDGFQMDWKFKW